MEDKANISSKDLGNIQLAIDRFSTGLETADGNAWAQLKPMLRGLSSHKPEKRCGYAVVLSAILDKFGEKFSEESVLESLATFRFTVHGKKKKSSKRTSSIAKALAYSAFIRTKIVATDEGIVRAAEAIAEIGTSRPPLLPFVLMSLGAITKQVGYRLLEPIAGLVPANLDGFIFWFLIAPDCPEDIREMIPEQFRQQSPFNQMTADSLAKTFLVTRQPWNSMVWRYVLANATEIELLTFWPQIFERLMKSEDVKTKVAVMHVVKDVLPTAKSELFPIVVSANFVKMINRLMAQTMVHETVMDFLDSMVTMGDSNVMSYILAFAYVDYRAVGGFEFHQKLFRKCKGRQIRKLFTRICEFGENDEIELRQRIAMDRSGRSAYVQNYRFDALRALLIASAGIANPSLSVSIFEFITGNFADQLTTLVADLVVFDDSRVEDGATLQDFVKDPGASHIDCCFKLYSMCTGIGSSPSMDTLIAPDMSNVVPRVDFILNAVQRANDPPLIRHAFKAHLKVIAPQIPAKDMVQFFEGYAPIQGDFSQATVDIFKVVVENCDFCLNLISPLFRLFCLTLKDIGPTLGQSVGDLVSIALSRDVKSSTSASPESLRSLFSSMSELSNKVLIQNERFVFKMFNKCLSAIVVASHPLSKPLAKSLAFQMNKAVEDFAFKSNAHFGEEVFNAFLSLPDGVPEIIFPILLRFVPKVTRVHRRVQLLNIITRIFDQARGADALVSHGREFNTAVMALINESYAEGKEDEKRFVKTLIAIGKWLSVIERKRGACTEVNVVDIKRQVQHIATHSKDQIQGQAKQILQALQRVEGKVHPKQRVFK